jgi:hypothetical protein
MRLFKKYIAINCKFSKAHYSGLIILEDTPLCGIRQNEGNII